MGHGACATSPRLRRDSALAPHVARGSAQWYGSPYAHAGPIKYDSKFAQTTMIWHIENMRRCIPSADLKHVQDKAALSLASPPPSQARVQWQNHWPRGRPQLRLRPATAPTSHLQ